MTTPPLHAAQEWRDLQTLQENWWHMMNDDALMLAREAYFAAFGNAGPYPFGYDDDTLAAVLMDAVANGKPVPETYDWYRDLPPGAVA